MKELVKITDDSVKRLATPVVMFVAAYVFTKAFKLGQLNELLAKSSIFILLGSASLYSMASITISIKEISSLKYSKAEKVLISLFFTALHALLYLSAITIG